MGRKNTKKPRSETLSEEIINALRETDTFVSGEEISRRLNITRAGLWKKIQNLRQRGYSIDAVPSKGYRLRSSPDIPTEEEVHSVFRGNRIGRKIVFHHETTSTNDLAMEMSHQREHTVSKTYQYSLKGSKSELDGTVIVADTQKNGRGRFGRTWISPPGVNLYFTVILEPFLPANEVSLITLMAAVAVASAIRKHTSIRAGIKWPNDILVGRKKVGGILTEMRSDTDMIHFMAVGIGVNVNMASDSVPEDLRPLITSLKEEKGRPVSRVQLLGMILSQLEYWYTQLIKKGRKTLISEWMRLNFTIGNNVRVKTQNRIVSGTADGISDDGELFVRLASGAVERVFSGEVTILKD
ncbi:MAG: biotin--[acetyl-CoA-carboxylase] ligase [Nitrospiraceae bacterium]|nr:MAG: biotin--[acetyl-CoA-carboxylase] ligase [Nitrospiraceae bacterium]